MIRKKDNNGNGISKLKNGFQQEFRNFDKEIEKIKGNLKVNTVEHKNIRENIDRVFKIVWATLVIQLMQAAVLVWKTLSHKF